MPLCGEALCELTELYALSREKDRSRGGAKGIVGGAIRRGSSAGLVFGPAKETPVGGGLVSARPSDGK